MELQFIVDVLIVIIGFKIACKLMGLGCELLLDRVEKFEEYLLQEGEDDLYEQDGK